AISYNNVGINLHSCRRYAEAGRLFQKALDMWRNSLGEDHPHTARGYGFVAFNLHCQEKHESALASLDAGARSYEAARLSVATGGLDRAAFGAKHSPYDLLAAARSRAGRSEDAWVALEADLARGLLDEMATRRGVGLTAAEQHELDELRA